MIYVHTQASGLISTLKFYWKFLCPVIAGFKWFHKSNLSKYKIEFIWQCHTINIFD